VLWLLNASSDIFNNNLNWFQLLRLGGTTFKPRRTGERKRKSVRGCITGPDLAVIALRVVVKGEQELEGKKKDQPVVITGKDHANRLGKKRRNRIIKFYALDKKDDITKYVVRRTYEKTNKEGEAVLRKNGDKTFYKAPKVQRMITETKLRRKKVARRNVIDNIKNSQKKAVDYEKLLKEYFAEKKEVKNTSKEKQASEVPRKQAA
jgi:small subunit ribosomal protein S6e